jgi:hypothetical protein
MRSVLLIILVAAGFSASAQWYRVDLTFKKKSRPAAIEQLADHSIERLPHAVINQPKIKPVRFGRSDYSYEASEAVVMKAAQHNMRFRVYNDASYNFSELAGLYAQQNRVSEAKWYLLQSNRISKEQNDDKHTVANLIDLATIKVNIGEFALAQTDLLEARDIANSAGLKDYLYDIDNMMVYIKQRKTSSAKPQLGYAETPQNSRKTE